MLHGEAVVVGTNMLHSWAAGVRGAVSEEVVHVVEHETQATLHEPGHVTEGEACTARVCPGTMFPVHEA